MSNKMSGLTELLCVGDIIQCINSRGHSGITRRKLYNVIAVTKGGNPIICLDSKRSNIIRRNRFILIDIISENLEKLGFIE